MPRDLQLTKNERVFLVGLLNEILEDFSAKRGVDAVAEYLRLIESEPDEIKTEVGAFKLRRLSQARRQREDQKKAGEAIDVEIIRLTEE